ncbi:MAG TPA: DNA internalization-related competence protein ComEC/Rec2 [Actinomycetota bacterium]|nr:DNA internalization-related competence protein ComEC/Rec2 [Actinomycetota bacterium]
MSSWILPAIASAMWAGLLFRPYVGDAVPVAVWFGAGVLGLAAGVALAPARGDEHRGALDRAGLSTTHPLAHAVASPRPDRSTPSWPAAAVASLATLALAIGWGSAHHHRVEGGLVARLAPTAVVVEGSLRVDPQAEADRWSAVLDVALIRWSGRAAQVHESVWLSGRDEPPAAVRGDRLRVSGTPGVPEDAGFGEFLLRRGIAAELRVSDAERLGPAGFAPIRWAQSVRELVGRSIVASFPPREAGLLLGLAVGDDSRLDPIVERDFRASGLSHLLVVSGGNVAMVLAPVLALGAALRLSRWPRFALGVGVTAFFVVLTGAEPSVMRAGVMAGLALVGVLLGRPRSSASILAAAVAGLLVLDPTLVWSVGFQLSVAATGGMIALATPISERLRFLPRPLAVAAGATLAAQIGVTPVLLFYFHEVPLSTVLANVLAFPAVAPALLLGLVAAGAGLLARAAGDAVAVIALVPMRYLIGVADRLARAPLPWITGGGGLTLVVGMVAAVGLTWWLRSDRRAPRTAIALCLALAPLLVWTNALTAGAPASLTVRFLDVGQGDAALVTSPGGATVLVDGGPDPAIVATALSALGVRRLDVVVATHPHADHVVGLPAVLARIPVGVLLEPGCPSDSFELETLLDAAGAEGVPVRHPRVGQTISVGDLRLEVLAPESCWHGTESDANNDSLVIRASIGEDTVLLTGDAEQPAQELLLERPGSLVADVLKVPHHGGATSLPEFFEAVRAEVCVVSSGRPNPYGHPTREALGWMGDAGCAIVRTDQLDDVLVGFERGTPVVASAS